MSETRKTVSATQGQKTVEKKAGKTVFIERGRFGDNPERNGKQADRLEQYGTHDTPELTETGKTDRVTIRVEQQRADNTTQQRNENKLTKTQSLTGICAI